MQWNRKMRYTPYNQWPATKLPQLAAQARQSKWRMQHHIQPASGLLNDPNGFSYFNGQWHLFYQSFPFGPVHGLKSWQHVTSDNLVDWHDEGLAIAPDTPYDSHGAYTGTALPVGDRLFIMYTGNVRTADWQREAYQIGAWMTADNQIHKLDQPLISHAPAGYTSSFRDPDLVKTDHGYYALIGAQTTDEQGALLVYYSEDLSKWDCRGAVNVPEAARGYMIECPNIVWIDQQPVLLFCPQGLSQQTLAYQNIYPNTSLVAEEFDLDQAKLTGAKALHQLDEGFDVYATQAINAPDGRALAVSWIGLPEVAYPTDQENWAHCLSFVKELTLKDGHLYQNPVAEVDQLRTTDQPLTLDPQHTATVADLDGSFELLMTVAADETSTVRVADTHNRGALIVTVDARAGQVVIDRSQTGHPFAEDYGQTRTAQVKPHTAINIRLMIDVSVFECYIDSGYSVMTGRFFLADTPTQLNVEASSSAAVAGKVWKWRQSEHIGANEYEAKIK
ncbi:sucrose-6-phosphate hydrolase [Lactiplantibacillus pentosus]|jgi:beta-fructofuranosidase|uniref:sucrose-6-phosphate hydrolase n=1 Tax=Lactiplantibacillus pentosus TaxID=1589 RepID=UPI000B54415A|nr:sucrose-6-phosphate hydrolase [Lactiplantibacillus pentosus]ASG79664.1 sucrose-6-phosphate hydrolase [Lactiplantibacillus pentosus]MCB5220445.1 sucrose-6-phosphate hydrolase [Lactiplantibacillus pentosus]MCT3288551.1 sucrose-6-phosphate hydrolase [Lactiplantibacillus pentosus]MDO7803649.1 sucrose-6-phosphate hydrolase [Lactiplantibacillus pentosus]WFC03408.1 sucrose-6-phosphate hydrolase [Lactiplantibacillus pentosus]